MIIKHLRLVKIAATPSAVSSVIPDCCNIGVIYRVLLGTNSAIFCGIWMHSLSTQEAVISFVNAALVLETICIFSLIMLCGCRKVALVQQFPQWLQRALCGLVPAMISVAIVSMAQSQAWWLGELVDASAIQMAVLSAFIGMLFQLHFELRAKAFSPVLGEAKLKALQSRIRPHFLFNSINAVLSLIRSDPRRAETALEDLADLFRVLMRETRDVSTLQDEIQLCNQYLSIEKIRLGDRLNVNWEIQNLSDDDLQRAQIASLLLQPLIENAVHHGVEPAQSNALISVRIQHKVDKIQIEIMNPYHPDHASKGNQMALSNIRERLSLLYDIESDFDVSIKDDQFRVRLDFPFVRDPKNSKSRDEDQERRSLPRD